MKINLILSALGLITLCVAGAAIAGDSEHAFVQAAMIGGQFEISSSRLALQNSQNPDVRGFAQQMIDDHTQIGNNLKSAIAVDNPDAAQPTVSLDARHQKMLDKLNDAKGAVFDKLYVHDQMAAHKEAVKLFRDYAEKGSDNALKTFATETLPTLRQHEKHALDIRNSM